MSYLGKGLSIAESRINHLGQQSPVVGTYDPVAGTITWAGNPTRVWYRYGRPPQLQGQDLVFQNSSGFNTLYLHGENMGASNSRGPGRASTCLAKIPLDSRVSVNHVSIQRAHRWMAQPRGTLSSLRFTLRDVYGAVHRLSDHGQNISFVLTWANQD